MKTAASIQKDVVTISQEGNQLQSDTISSVKDIVKVMQELLKKTLRNIKGVLEKQESSINTLVTDKENLIQSVGLLTSMVEKVNTILLKHREEISRLREFVKTVKHDE